MLRKVIGIVLFVLGVFIALVLFTYGGPIFPHLIGPIVFVTIGGILLLYHPRARG